MHATDSWFDQREKCPICHSSQFRLVHAAAFDQPPLRDYFKHYDEIGGVEFDILQGADYRLCECAQCRGLFQQNIPNDALMARLYEHWIDPEKARERHRQQNHLDLYAHHAQEILQLIAYFRRRPAELAFFDFGMGWGQWLLMAKAFGCQTAGAELSEARINHAHANGLKTITWDEIPGQQFDFINTEQVFEHIPEPLETLRHLKKALKPGGLIKISVPDAEGIDRRLEIMDWQAPRKHRNSLNAVAPLEHINCYRRESFAVMAAQASMEEVALPLRLQYKYWFAWGKPARIAKNLVLPIYRNVLKTQNYVLLRPVS